jgi:hypothetical protein
MGFSDNVDHSAETEDMLREYEIQRIRREAKKPSLPFTGACYYCGSDVHSPKVYCDAECAKDYENERRLLAIAGRL